MSAQLPRPFRAGVFSSMQAADRVVEKLLAGGFRREQLSVICSQDAVQRHFEAFHHEDSAGKHTPMMAATGGAIGAALGGFTAATIAAATGGTALFVAGGLGLMAAGGIAGGLVGAMLTRGVEKEIADYYDQAVQKGKILVAVEVEEDEADKLAAAERIIAEGGAEPLPLREG